MSLRMEFESLEGTQKPNQESNPLVDSLLDFFNKKISVSGFYWASIGEIVKGTMEAFQDKTIHPGAIQELVDRVECPRKDYSTASLGAYLSGLIMLCPDKEISLDITEFSMFPVELGTHLEGKVLRVAGNSGSWFGARAKNCEFYADQFSHDAGSNVENCVFTANSFLGTMANQAKRSIFRAKKFISYGENIGYGYVSGTFLGIGGNSVDCEFYSEEPFVDICREQDGSSKYFVKGVRVR